MGKRRSFGNPLSRVLGEVIDKVAPEVLDGTIDVLTGPGSKGKKSASTSSSSRSTDWHTRLEGTPRKRS